MRVSTLLIAYAFLFVTLTLGSAAMAIWTTERGRMLEERIELAEQSYHAHLSLQSNIYQLFKQHGDALIIGDRDNGALEAVIQDAIGRDIQLIRDTIGREIELVGEEEIEELARLAEIERRVNTVTVALTRISSGEAGSDQARLRAQLVDILDREVDIQIAQLISEALAEEEEEVAETLVEAAAFRDRVQIAAVAVGLVAAIALGYAIWTFNRYLRRPILALSEGVRAYEAERFDQDIKVRGGREFENLGALLTNMARKLRQRQLSQKELNERLETEVAGRTRELEKLLRQFEISEANRRRLMADISHELRTPLTIIQGEAEVTLRGGPQEAETYMEALSRIRDSAKHTNRIVDDMLLVARQEADELRLDLRDVDLMAVIDDARGLFPGAVRLDSGLTSLRIRGDEMRMRQCLLALFNNAARYGGPDIVVRAFHEGGRAIVTVEDNGSGLTDIEKSQAFDRFYRGSNASGVTGEGTGLGLPIVRAIVKAHGGDVELEDGREGGLRVAMSFPTPRAGIRLVPGAASDSA
ncbi:sensor histidine kinase [Pontivivens ytuae]|uniref:histidine kinase n=1 Tax=Pontivivens ytuae TaxID=2789856 RepID=A0A7S9LUN9_9RHOB|nr:HAMP domain-containing sensor histidine kinase [Pontivivens ytuae]QPH55496.1 HAMP domain-containing histidine kinase [Pontivivens ytuae]